MKGKTISFTVTPSQYEEILVYAVGKGFGGQAPASSFALYAVEAAMKKNALGRAEAERGVRILGERGLRLTAPAHHAPGGPGEGAQDA